MTCVLPRCIVSRGDIFADGYDPLARTRTPLVSLRRGRRQPVSGRHRHATGLVGGPVTVIDGSRPEAGRRGDQADQVAVTAPPACQAPDCRRSSAC